MDNNPELLQSDYWARVKSQFGWRSFVHRYGESTVRLFKGSEFRALHRSVGPAGSVGIVYLGYAFPLAAEGREAVTADRTAVLRTIAKEIERLRPTLPGNTVFIRWDVPWSVDPEKTVGTGTGFAPTPFRKTSIRVQPPDTVLIDLSAFDNAFPSNMKKKTRYNIRLAEKRGVTVTRYSGDEALVRLPEWYRIYRETAERDRIGIHPEAYYRTVFSEARGVGGEFLSSGGTAMGSVVATGDPDLYLYLAHHEDDLLAGIVVAHYNGSATYLYGASSDVKRNLMASYLLQWRAMVDAREEGCRIYDLFGIPPTDDPGHPMHGLYRFKTGFGGEVVHRPGCLDLDLRPLGATLFHGAEELRQWYHHSFRKRRRG